MGLIKQLKDKLGNLIYPQTLTKAVYDESGNRLDNTLATLNTNLTNKTTYSTNEVEVGTFDGKTLYRKVFSYAMTDFVSSSSLENIRLNHGLSNVTFRKIEVAYHQGSVFFGSPYTHYPSGVIYTSLGAVTQTHFEFLNREGWGSAWNVVLICEYTKN